MRARTARAEQGQRSGAYNPIVGRFVSADPYFDAGLGTQGWNRYSYVGNRGLSGRDPSGFTCRQPASGLALDASELPSLVWENGQGQFLDEVMVYDGANATGPDRGDDGMYNFGADMRAAFSMRSAFDGMDMFERAFASSSRFNDNVFENLFPGLASTVYGAMERADAFEMAHGPELAAIEEAASSGDEVHAAALAGALADVLSHVPAGGGAGTASSQTPLWARSTLGMPLGANSAGIAASNAAFLSEVGHYLGRIGAVGSGAANAVGAALAYQEGDFGEAATSGAFAIATGGAFVLAPNLLPAIGAIELGRVAIGPLVRFGDANYESWSDLFGPYARMHQCP